MKKRNLSDEEMKAIRDAIKGIVGNEDLDVEGQVFTDRPTMQRKDNHRKIIREMEDIALAVRDLEDRAEKLVMDTLEGSFDCGSNRILYGNAFFAKMNLYEIRRTLDLAVEFIRREELSPEDER